MSRSIKKGPFVDESLMRKVLTAQDSGSTNKVIKTWSRRSTILPEFIGLTFANKDSNSAKPGSVKRVAKKKGSLISKDLIDFLIALMNPSSSE